MKVLVALLFTLSCVVLSGEEPEWDVSSVPDVAGDSFGNGGDEPDNLEALRKLCKLARSNEAFAPLNEELYVRYCAQVENGRN